MTERYKPRIIEHAVWEIRCRGCDVVVRFRGPLKSLYKAMRKHCEKSRTLKLERRAWRRNRPVVE